jgi:glycine/D-amino acid oxidase-like deaminating enzyme
MKDVIVVGAGIVGATVAKAFQAAGQDVLLIDSREPMAGTRPSGGHLKPSWLGGMKKAEYEPAMKLLDDIWGLEEAEFTIRPSLGDRKSVV